MSPSRAIIVGEKGENDVSLRKPEGFVKVSEGLADDAALFARSMGL
jgi:hypothetical protein